MRPSVQVLPSTLIDQIAAGEVVERPASVVKELIENAIDAEATVISVLTEGGGAARIRISDNGFGMTAEDARLAVERHATSKLRHFSDLHQIGTLGFRGEALPSIASVSRFSLTTRTRDQVAASCVRIEGGTFIDIADVGASPGTTVEARDLFYNVPARLKFLKAPQTENAHISEVLRRAAFAHPKLHLILERDGRKVRDFLPDETLAGRTRSILQTEGLFEIESERDGIRVHAILSPPEKSRNGAGSLFLYVNRRPVRDRRIARAVAFAYGSVLPPGRYPLGVVHIDLDPSEVDVNVHPQKSEVRFSRGRHALDAVTKAIAKGLANSGTTSSYASVAPNLSANAHGELREPGYWQSRLNPYRERDAADLAASLHVRDADPWNLSSDEGFPPGAGTPGHPSPELGIDARGRFGRLKVLGQAKRMLIVCEDEQALVVLDQHAVDERIRYAKLRDQYQKSSVVTQRLLFPERIDLDASEMTSFETMEAELLRFGVEASRIGEHTVAVRAVPALVAKTSAESLLRTLLSEGNHDGEREFSDLVDMKLATMACHGSIRAGDSLSVDECRALLGQLDAVEEFASHCPHGRPVIVEFPFAELERKLGR